MFTLLEKIAGFLLAATKAYREQQDRKLRREFGASIVLCYVRLLEVISTGERIVKHLEFYVTEFHTADSLFENWREYWCEELETNLRKQSMNLGRLSYALLSIRRELSVLAPEVAELLPLTSSGKVRRVGKLWGLVWVLRKGKVPIDFLEQTHQDMFGPAMDEYVSIVVAPEWDVAIYERLIAYLSKDMPRSKLDTLKKCAEQLHELIIKQFTLEEILWSANEFYDQS